MTYDGSIKIRTSLDDADLKTGLTKLRSSLRRFASTIGIAFGTTAIVNFGKESVKAATELSNALKGMQGIVEGQGRSFAEAKAFAQEYISDGLVPMTNAATAYKNLAARGYNDEQIQKVLVALKDSAAFGRQAGYSIGDAITTATQGLKNENSILVDNAGVTKNVSVMWKEYAQSIGKGVQSLTLQERIQAEVNGILRETRYQTGDAAKLSSTYSGQISKLSFNFNELKIAIGRAITPLVQSALPTINAIITSLTSAANAAAQFISVFLGVELSQTSSANAAKKAADGEAELAKNTEAAADAAKNAVAGFDKLNIVTQETGNSAENVSATNFGTGDNINQKTDITVSPKIEKAAKKTKKFFDDLKKALSKFAPLLKGIATGFLAAFGFKWVSGAVTKIKQLSVFTSMADAVRSALLAMNTNFEATGKLLPSVGAGFKDFRSHLSTTAKLMVGAGGTVATFAVAKDAMEKYETGTIDATTAIANIGIATGIAAGAMYAALGPAGLALAALGIFSGAIAGTQKAHEEMREEFLRNDFFDGEGMKMESLSEYVDLATEKYRKSAEQINEWGDEIESNNGKIDEAITFIENFQQSIETNGGKISKEDIPEIKSAMDGLKDNVDSNMRLAANIINDVFSKAVKDAGEELGITAQKLSEFQGIVDTELDGIQRKINGYLAKTALTESEQKELQELFSRYTSLSTAASESVTDFKLSLKELGEGKIDFDSPEKAVETIENLVEQMKSVGDETDQARLKAMTALETFSSKIASLNLTEAEKKYWERYFEKMGENIQNTYDKQKGDLNEQFSSVIGMIQSQFEEKIQNAKDSYEFSWWDDFYAKAFSDVGGEQAMRDKMLNDAVNSQFGEIKNAIDEAAKKLEITPNKEAGKKLLESLTESGINAVDGFISGAKSRETAATDYTSSLAVSASDAFAEGQDEHSPAEAYVEHGENAVLGFVKGVEENEHLAIDAAETMAENVTVTFENALDKDRVAGSFGNMFNVILGKTEIFCERFRAAMNEMITIMQASVNSASLNPDGKISITKLPPIKIPKLATGAVIPPNAQFLALLGDQRSGRNLEAPESLIRQIVREESGYSADVSEKLDRLISVMEAKKESDIRLIADGRELARAVRRGESSLGYPIAAR